MVATKGREVRSLEDAEAFIRDFIGNEQVRCSGKGIDTHSLDFDLYLPWLASCVQLAGGEGDLSLCELNRLYMDAAWSLVQKGYLRPGPRTITGTDLAAGYGKGYSLTPQGRQWVPTGPRAH